MDHYAVLGLSIDVTRDEIKRRFRDLAKRHHPDRAGGDGLKFLEIYNAYKVLSNDGSRNLYNPSYLRFIRSAMRDHQGPPRAQAADQIPISRLVYPGNVADLARRGLLRKKYSSRDRKVHLKIDYDVELPLFPREMNASIIVRIPVVTRTLCPDCRGSNTHCPACNGKGSYRKTRLVRLNLEGGLTDGQILELNLARLRPEPMSYFKKKTLRIKISERIIPIKRVS